jgi:hypothetical protein
MAVAQKNMIQLESASKMQFEKELNKLIKRASSSSAKKEYLIDGGRIVKEKARELAPVAKPRLRDRKFKRSNSPAKLSPNVFYTYKKMGQKAGKGKGVITGKYAIENLKYSIHVLNDVKKIKAPVAIIGPWVNKRKSVLKPNERTSNGWYAQMIFGSAEAFAKKVTNAALIMVQGRVFNSISDRIINKIDNETRSNQIIK